MFSIEIRNTEASRKDDINYLMEQLYEDLVKIANMSFAMFCCVHFSI